MNNHIQLKAHAEALLADCTEVRMSKVKVGNCLELRFKNKHQSSSNPSFLSLHPGDHMYFYSGYNQNYIEVGLSTAKSLLETVLIG
jgi:hypothetical protein